MNLLKYSSTLLIFAAAAMFIVSGFGCGENVFFSDIRRYIPSDAAMAGYLDTEKILCKQHPQPAECAGGTVYILLNTIYTPEKALSFDKCYFFSSNACAGQGRS